MWTASVWPARAPRTSIGPASACPSSSGDERGSNCDSSSSYQPAFGVAKRTESPGSIVEHRLEVAREVPVQRAPLERQLVDHAASLRTAATTRSTDGMYASSIVQYGYGTS